MKNTYENPLITRYASKEMSENFSDDKKFKIWRLLWIVLAEAEMELGLPISKEQIIELKKHQNNINYDVAEKKEHEVRHDVMAHIYAYGEQCPHAKPIIHLGATSCYVGDNTDIMIMADGMKIVKKKLLGCMKLLTDLAQKYKTMPTLGFTHLQPAQLTTVGKRACLWLQDILMDYEALEYQIGILKLLGVKGTTGTQASFLTLFNGDHEKVKQLDKKVVNKLGYENSFSVTGQTYPRKLDSQVMNVLSGIAQSAYKFSNDIRILQHLKEIEEPFETQQIGSSAMAYKRNPMRSERISSLARYAITTALNPAITAATQWFERTLDDSANKRITMPQIYLTVDAILNLYANILEGLVVYEKVISKHINEELPFMATETILMEAVKKGGDRQDLHEKIRVYAMETARNIKEKGLHNDLLEKIIKDPCFLLDDQEIKVIMNAEKFTGRSAQQVTEFIENDIEPILQKNRNLLDINNEVNC